MHRSYVLQAIGSLFYGMMFIMLLASCGPETKAGCQTDNQCAKGMICLKTECVVGCRTKDDCPENAYCVALKCSEQVCTPGNERDCYDGPKETNNKGLCQGGKQICLADGTEWSSCFTQQLPQAEQCDKEDNNCDGKIDDGLTCTCTPGSKRKCYNGPKGSDSVGICRSGIQYCETDSTWGKCLSQIKPVPEVCDQIDNNCNGLVDEFLDCSCKAGEERTCTGGPDTEQSTKGICQNGKQYCLQSNQWGPCVGYVLSKVEENAGCNGQDDDCDGQIDNQSGSKDPLTQPCFTGPPGALNNPNSPCKQGLRTCQDGKWSECTGQVSPKPEECNGIDDDCNGKIDDEITPRNCYPNGKGNACTPCQAKDDEDTCNKKKNDPTAIWTCKGTCTMGNQTCNNGKWSNCTGAITPTGTDTCGDGLDNNCDGKVDESCKGCTQGDTKSCYSGPAATRGVLPCKDGIQTCNNDTWGACQKDQTPSIEVCDGIDNDCDGTIDNSPEIGKPCTDNKRKGSCQAGKIVCKADGNGTYSKQCEQLTPAASSETCDGQDEDCNGQIDDIPDKGQPCTLSSLKGTCANGAWQCQQTAGKYAKVCTQINQPGNEVCDGKDNNCDGTIDNIQGVCPVAGQKGACARGTPICSTSTDSNGNTIWKQTCNPGTPQPETCNSQDDDCDGQIDNIPNSGKSCVFDATKQGSCGLGIVGCQNGQPACLSQANPTIEICNGKDDDCDGQTDEQLTTRSCQTACGFGTETCTGGAWKNCTAPQPTTEICDGKDNDCDGTIDEKGGTCTVTGAKGPCAIGIVVCDPKNAQATICKSKVNGTLEIDCNGIDDDCDGQVDENYPHAGKLCPLPNTPGLLGYIRCIQGVPTCTAPPSIYTSSWPAGMAWVAPVKDFQMGSTGPAALPNEKPTFKVTLTRPFAIGTHEVTYKEFFAIAGYYVKYGSAIGRRSCTACGTDNSCPISHLTWDQAAAYTNLLSQKYGLPACYNCNPTPTHRKGTTPWPGTCTVKAAWQGANFSLCPGFRLPTEAEWEVAYRAGSKGDFYTGQICTSEQHCDITKSTTSIDIRSIAWYTKDTAATCSTHYGRIKKVGLKQPNAWGLFDMAGNVWEWTHDVYAGYTSTPKRDPSGPQTGPSRTLRGGCVDTSQAFLRASSRMAVNHPPQKDSVPRIYAGFRVARSVIGEFYCKTDADCTITVDKLYCINNTCRAQTTNKEPTGEPTTNVDAGLSQPD